jgi:hypothetical protein
VRGAGQVCTKDPACTQKESLEQWLIANTKPGATPTIERLMLASGAITLVEAIFVRQTRKQSMHLLGFHELREFPKW